MTIRCEPFIWEAFVPIEISIARCTTLQHTRNSQKIFLIGLRETGRFHRVVLPAGEGEGLVEPPRVVGVIVGGEVVVVVERHARHDLNLVPLRVHILKFGDPFHHVIAPCVWFWNGKRA